MKSDEPQLCSPKQSKLVRGAAPHSKKQRASICVARNKTKVKAEEKMKPCLPTRPVSANDTPSRKTANQRNLRLRGESNLPTGCKAGAQDHLAQPHVVVQFNCQPAVVFLPALQE